METQLRQHYWIGEFLEKNPQNESSDEKIEQYVKLFSENVSPHRVKYFIQEMEKHIQDETKTDIEIVKKQIELMKAISQKM